MKTFIRRAFILVMVIPIFLWATVYELAVNLPRQLYRVWRNEAEDICNNW